MFKIQGLVEIQVRDAESLELIDIKKQYNVITKKFYYDWVNGANPIYNTLCVSTSTAPSYEDWCTVPACDTTGFIPTGITTPSVVAAIGGTPAYIQIMRRFNAPVSDRDINTVLLSSNASTTTFSANIAAAYVSLSVPCTQTSSQILDVYYRLQLIPTTEKTYNYYIKDSTHLLQCLFGISGSSSSYNLPNSAGCLPVYSHVSTASNFNPTSNGSMYPNFARNKAISINTTASTTIDAVNGKLDINWSYSTSQGIGHLLGAISVMRVPQVYVGLLGWREASATTNIIPPNGSQIQPIFSHANTTLSEANANPFLDSIPSSGTGVLNISGAWVDEMYPELYKIDIVTGGDVGVATYQFSKRNHFGFCGPTYISNVDSLPGAYNFYDTGIQYLNKPHTAGKPTCESTIGEYGQRIEKYDHTHFISYDQTGVSRYNCLNQYAEIWDNSTTPALNATNIRQAAVNPGDGSIWIACADTGIYRIDATGITITNFTVTDGLPSNQCFALDIGRNNVIWAICTDGVVSSSDNGATWVTYNSGTTPAFDSTVLNADWSSVHYMRVDPTHIDDQMCFIRKENAALNTSTGMVWWSRGAATVFHSTYTSADMRRCPNTFNVSDNDGIWALTVNTSLVRFTFGTSISAAISIGSNTPRATMFIRDEADTQDLIMIISPTASGPNISTIYSGATYNAYINKSVLLYNSAGTLVSTTNGSSPTSGASGYVDSSTVCVHMGNGIIAGYTKNTFGGSGGYMGIIHALSGDGTPSGGALEYLIWEKYGWDGTQWVLGNANAKTTHADDQILINGISANFVNGASGISFIAGDYYTCGVNNGILKNNAMTLSGTNSFYVLPTELLTDFDGIIRIYPNTTGVVTWRKVSSSITINVDNSLTNAIPYRSYAMSAGSMNRVFGDFSISGTFDVNTNQRYSVGIKTENIFETPYIRENQYNTWGFNVLANAVTVVNSANTTVNTPPTISTPITWNISRVGSTLTFSTDGIVRYTTTDASYSFIINVRYIDTISGVNAYTINPITIDSSGGGYYVGLGNNITGTGIYNTLFWKSYIDSVANIMIDGTPLTTLNSSPATAPNTGVASLAAEEGLLFFDATDVGKTVTGSYIATYQTSTPCNIIPV